MDVGKKERSKNPTEMCTRLPDRAAEIHEEMRFKRGLIVFDIIFDNKGKPYVLEVQGAGSGINGILDNLQDDLRVTDDAKDFARKYQRGKSGYPNPRWYNVAVSNKDQQVQLIPEECRPLSVVNGDITPLFKHGPVIIKPINWCQGLGIIVFTKEDIHHAKEYAALLTRTRGGFIAQQFITPSGAELANESIRNHAASLRLLVPFVVENGEPNIAVHNVGYQRVSLRPIPSDISANRDRLSDACVVNYSRGAYAVPMSDAEYKKVQPIVLKTIKHIIKKGHETSAYRNEFLMLAKNALYIEAEKIQGAFSFPYHFSFLETEMVDKIGYALHFRRHVAHIAQSLNREMRDALRQAMIDIDFRQTPGTLGGEVYITQQQVGLFGGGSTRIIFDDISESWLAILTEIKDTARKKQKKGKQEDYIPIPV